MLIHILKFMQGYVRIRLYGFSPERFLNLCSNHDILIWGLVSRDDAYEMYLSVKGLKKLRPILKKTKTKITILEKKGLPFFFYKYRKRKMFFIGVIICMGFIYTLSLFIWDIHIDGNYTRTTDVILDFLESKNVYHGLMKKKIDCEEIESMLRIEYNDIIWASAEIKGTRLLIHVQENTDEEEETQTSGEASDLVAEKEGIVTSMITRSGTPMVQVGSIVKKGDILVTGRLEIMNDNGEVSGYHYCNADADIMIKTDYDYEDSFSMTYEEKEYTGEEKKQYYVRVLGEKLLLAFGKIKYKDYERVGDEKQLRLLDNFYLPLYGGKITCKEYKMTEKTYSKEQAQALAKEHLDLFCKKLTEKGVEIIENSVKIHMEEGTCSASGKLQVLEKAGIPVPTEIIELPEEGQNADELNGNNP